MTNTIQSVSVQSKFNGKVHRLNKKHAEELLIKRGLNPDWVIANCSSIDILEATRLLGYTAKSPGILIKGANGQYQFKPDKPWANKQGKKAPKYRTAAGDEYDALLPKHPTDPNYWLDIEKLKERCYQINGHPLLVITEGGIKAIAACFHDLPTLALLGVEMGLTPSKNDPQGKRYLVRCLEYLAKEGFGFILAFDCDIYINKLVIQALIKLATQLEKFGVPVYILPKWNESEGKGIDDYIQNQGIEEFRKKLLFQTVSFQDWLSEYGQDAFEQKLPKPDIIGAQLAEQYRDYWVYCDELKTWLAYSLNTKGIWTIVTEQYLAAEIDAILESRNVVGYGTNTYIQNIIGKLKRKLFVREWSEKSSTDWLPFKNGVLELATNKLHEHSSSFRFTWQLPRDYTVVETSWKNIDDWLTEATQGNKEHKQLLIHFAAAVLRGRNDLQKFLHLNGPGGSGKSTFTNLLTGVIGEENTANLDLPNLEDKHEIARIFGKRLVIFADQDKAPKKVSNFKKLTGQDRLSGRKLFHDGFEYTFSGLAVVTSNSPIFHTNIGSWLTRRVAMIPFDYEYPSHKKRDLIKEFNPELSAFTTYLLSISNAEIDTVFKGLNKQQRINSTVWESQIRSDGLAGWVNEWIIADPDSKVKIGSNKFEWSTNEDYCPQQSTLYGSYVLYCQRTNRSAKSPQNFSAELLELVNRILGWQVEKARVKIDGQTTRVIKGLKLRSNFDNQPTVEEILEGDNLGDNLSDNLSDNLKASPDIESDNGDNLNLLVEKNKNNFDPSCDSPPSVICMKEVKNNIYLNTSEVVTPVTNPTQQGFEVVTPVVIQAVTQVVTQAATQINWQSYPYQSRDTLTLKARANKVKERVLACTTNNELISLYAEGKVSEAEINWLKSNLFTTAECHQLEAAQTARQTNLFSENNEELTAEALKDTLILGQAALHKVKKQIDTEVKRIGWSTQMAVSYIEDKYSVSRRKDMNIEQLVELRDYLRGLTTKEVENNSNEEN
jgi:putative DNA primase/helicase